MSLWSSTSFSSGFCEVVSRNLLEVSRLVWWVNTAPTLPYSISSVRHNTYTDSRTGHNMKSECRCDVLSSATSRVALVLTNQAFTKEAMYCNYGTRNYTADILEPAIRSAAYKSKRQHGYPNKSDVIPTTWRGNVVVGTDSHLEYKAGWGNSRRMAIDAWRSKLQGRSPYKNVIHID